MAFRGWPAEAVEFFEGLEEDNSKTYWETHRDAYERCVRAPMEQLLEELEPEFGGGRIFRPYRDVRFSKDKSPYKTNIAAMVGDMGYVSFSATGLGVGCGIFHMAPDQLDRYREAVAADPAGHDLGGITDGLRRQRIELVGHDRLKTAPKGYAKDHPRIDLLRWKGVAAYRQWAPASWLTTAKARVRVVETLRAAGPLREWLAANVGPTTLEPPAERPSGRHRSGLR